MTLPRAPLHWAFLAAAAIAAVGAARADGAKAPAAPAPPPPGSFEAVIASNPISAILKGQKLWTTPEEPQDWVKATRPQELNYMPVGITPGNHTTKVKTAAELAAAKADLDAARTLVDRAAAPPAVAPPAVAPHARTDKKASAAAVRPKPPLTTAAGAPD